MGIKVFFKKNKIISPIVWRCFYAKQAGDAYRKNKALCDRLLTIEKSHKGERCFIIGTGPSLKSEDLDVLRDNNIDCFGTHRIFTTFEKTSWRPTYYVAQDYALIEKISDEIKAMNCPVKILPAFFEDEFKNDSQYMYFVLREYVNSTKKIHFSESVNKYICQGYTVTYAAIQLAVWMGYSEIYLLGVDHNYSLYMDKNGNVISDDKVKDYFNNENYRCDNLPRLDDSSRGFLEAKQYADKHGIKIMNATRGGKLEIYPRVNFDTLFTKED